MRLLILLLASVPVFGQGWTQLTGTTFVSGSVCVPNAFNSGTYTTGSFGWADNCYNMIGNWNGAIADTKRNRLIMWGMGHVETPGNELYSLDLVTASAGSKGTSNGSSVPAIRRLNDPSNPRDYPTNPSHYITQADGSPISRHTYASMVYLPKSDRMFAWAGQEYDGAYAQSDNLWLLQLADDMSSPSWEARTPTGIPSSIIWANCVLDTTQATDEAVFCIGGNSGNHYMWRYNVTTNTWSTAVGFGLWTIGSVLQTEGIPVVDPNRRMIYHIGYGSNFSAGKFYSIMMDSPYTSTDLTSTVMGCSALMSAKFPGLVWDPTLNKIVGYPNTGNSVYVFDPATMQCTQQTFSGGPTGSTQTVTNGLFGRFNYFPSLGKYVVVNNHVANAYTLQLNATPTHGLGSSTLTCVDRDGDGYGTGPGCTGPDADDQDSAVHTGAQFVTKWTTLKLGLAHLGYAPTNFWYLATTGSDSATCSDTDGSTHISTPCATWAHIASSVAAGDVVILRGGTYSFLITPPTGTAGNPVIIMSYPGELATFSSGGTGISATNRSYLVVDGIKCSGNQTSDGCIAGLGGYGTTANSLDAATHVTLRHIESTGNKWGVVVDTVDDAVIEDSVFHDNISEHGAYVTNHDGFVHSTDDGISTRNMKNFLFRRNITYGNPYNGLQVNGRFSNAVIEQNLSYGNDLAGYQFKTGVNHSTFRNNVAFGNSRSGLNIDNYAAWCVAYDSIHVGTTCPYDQNYNVIENFSYFGTGKDQSGSSSVLSSQAAIAVSNADTGGIGDMGHNIYRNITAISPATGNQYQPIVFYGEANNSTLSAITAYAATSTFANVMLHQLDVGSGSGTAVVGIGNQFPVDGGFGYIPKSCAQLATTGASVTGCASTDPLFTAASASYWNSLGSFDLRLSASSLAISGGTAPISAEYDVLGNPLSATSPSLGAYAYQGAVCSLSGTLPSGTVGAAYTGSLSASGCTASTYTASGLGTGACSGLSLNGSTGAITGTPPTAGTCSFTGSYDTVSGQAFSFTVAASGGGSSGGSKAGGKVTHGGKVIR